MDKNRGFLPISRQDMIDRNIDQLDFVFVSGDAYVDDPSFAHALICRVLESRGYSVGLICQPDWKDDDSISALGEPRLGFLVCAGNMDSMVNHYTVNKKRRHDDAYSPGGEGGLRPNYATVVYSNLIRKSYKDKPIIIGGIEASLRRMAHYDYWSDKIRKSILLDAAADIGIYGMGEKAIVEIAEALDAGIDVRDITYIRGTYYKASKIDEDALSLMGKVDILPSFDEICADKRAYAASFKTQYENTDAHTAHKLIEQYSKSVYIVQNEPQFPLTTEEMDDVYSLPYMRTYHPSYEAAGGVPAISEIKFSLTSTRGCFGGCNFCALTFHEGRTISARSHESLVDEAVELTKMSDFKGYIHDVGGPSANFRHPSCKKQLDHGVCKHKQCLFPKPCDRLDADHSDYVALLRKLRKVDGVKKVFIRSGIRYDYALLDKDDTFIRELIKYHISGQLRVAPEHITPRVLCALGKPEVEVYNRFVDKFYKINDSLHMKQYVVPYLMSSHPGSTMSDAIKLAEYIRDLGYMPEQVQDFYPTPATVSTCMYYTGIDPISGEKIYVERNPHRKAMQRALIQYKNPANYDLVYEALTSEKRFDLIGFGDKCLIRPRGGAKLAGGSATKNGAKLISGSATKNGAKSAGGSATRNGAKLISGSATKNGAKAVGSSATRNGAKSVGSSATKNGAKSVGSSATKNGAKSKKKTIRNVHKKK